MAITRYTTKDAFQNILLALAEKNIECGDEVASIVGKVINNFVYIQGHDVEATYCDSIVQRFSELHAKGALTALELGFLNSIPDGSFENCALAVGILKDGGICNAMTLNGLFDSHSCPYFYAHDVATAMVLFNQAGLLNEATLEFMKKHENPATLSTPLALLRDNNVLKREYAEILLTDRHPDVINFIVALEKAHIQFNLQQDVLDHSTSLPLVLRFLAFQRVTDSEKTLLTQKNVDAVRALRNNKDALKNLLDRVNDLYFMKQDYTQDSFDTAVYYAAKQLPLPLELGHRFGRFLVGPVAGLSIFHQENKPAGEGAPSQSPAKRPGQ